MFPSACGHIPGSFSERLSLIYPCARLISILLINIFLFFYFFEMHSAMRDEAGAKSGVITSYTKYWPSDSSARDEIAYIHSHIHLLLIFYFNVSSAFHFRKLELYFLLSWNNNHEWTLHCKSNSECLHETRVSLCESWGLAMNLGVWCEEVERGTEMKRKRVCDSRRD